MGRSHDDTGADDATRRVHERDQAVCGTPDRREGWGKVKKQHEALSPTAEEAESLSEDERKTGCAAV